MDVNGLDKIEELYAFVAVDETGEGITAFLGPDGTWMPMVGADPARVDSLKLMAQSLAQTSGKKIVLAKFSVREDVEVIEP